MAIAASWVLGLLLSIGFTGAGYAKVTEQPVMIRARDHLGLSADTYRTVGVAELAGALGVLLGLMARFAWVGFFAGCGLFALMIGAIGHHFKVHDEPVELAPAAAMAALSILYLTAVATS